MKKSTFDSIIVLEDDHLINKLICKKLIQEGYNITPIFNAKDAIEILEKSQNYLLLLDYMLPDMSGEELINYLNEKNLLVPFIIITGHGNEKLAVRMMKLGAYDYIVKDKSFLDILVSVISKVSKQLLTEKNLNKTVDQLARSEEKYKTIAGNIIDLICVHDKSGILTYLSPSVAELTGYELKELIGKPIFDIIHPNDIDLVKDFFNSVIGSNTESNRIEFRINKKTGEIGWFESTFKGIRNSSTEVFEIQSLSRDITQKKSAEQKLRESEELYKKLIAALPDMVVITDNYSNIIYINDIGLKLLGIKSFENLKEKSIFSIISSSDRERAILNAKKMFDHPVGPREYFFIGSGNKPIPVELHGEVLRNEDNSPYGIIYVCRNIFERKKSEEKLKESQEKYSMIINNTRDIIYSYLPDGSFAFISEGVRQYGWKPEEVLSKNIMDFIHADDLNDAKEAFNKTLVEGLHEPFQCRLKTKKGGYEWVEESSEPVIIDGKLVQVNGVIRNISERKSIEAELRKSEEKYRGIFENIQDVYYETNLEGLLLEMSPSIYRLAGFKREDLIGKSIIELYDLSESRTELIKTLTEKESITDYEVNIKNIKGEVINCSLNSILKLDEKGKPQKIIGSIRDISERKKSEKEIKKLYSNLEKIVSERTKQLELSNNELEAFSYSVSHDLRAPLRSISGFSQALLEDYYENLEGQAKDYLNRIVSSCSQMTQLIDDLLNLSRISRWTINSENVNLSVIANEIINEFKTQQPDKSVNISISDKLVVSGDKQLLKIVVQNLLENAWKYSSKNDSPKIEFGKHKEEGKEVFFVKDNGVGFDMKYSGKLFGVFQRLHSTKEFPGSGVGLSTVQRIVQRHNGQIWADAKVNEGATFFFTIGNI
jgi:PAS domain S-box-containing protein